MSQWSEKYRPTTLATLKCCDSTRYMLEQIIVTKTMPNILFHGPAGTGKTSAAWTLAHGLFGENYKLKTSEINASDDRGIDTIRTKVKGLVNRVSPKVADGPSWKLIILDEVDAMTTDAQAALRQLMESSYANSRFILICNYIFKIINPIRSRCANLFCGKILVADAIEGLKNICLKENININDAAITQIVETSDGDLRASVNKLQTIATMEKLGITTDETDFEVITDICPKAILEQIQYLIKERPTRREAEELIRTKIRLYGKPFPTLIETFCDVILATNTLSEGQKANSILALCRFESDSSGARTVDLLAAYSRFLKNLE